MRLAVAAGQERVFNFWPRVPGARTMKAALPVGCEWSAAFHGKLDLSENKSRETGSTFTGGIGFGHIVAVMVKKHGKQLVCPPLADAGKGQG
jgi:hypothetical protein